MNFAKVGISIILILIILFTAKADINHGHGLDNHTENIIEQSH